MHCVGLRGAAFPQPEFNAAQLQSNTRLLQNKARNEEEEHRQVPWGIINPRARWCATPEPAPVAGDLHSTALIGISLGNIAR